jgi:hypothetical protein
MGYSSIPNADHLMVKLAGGLQPAWPIITKTDGNVNYAFAEKCIDMAMSEVQTVWCIDPRPVFYRMRAPIADLTRAPIY